MLRCYCISKARMLQCNNVSSPYVTTSRSKNTPGAAHTLLLPSYPAAVYTLAASNIIYDSLKPAADYFNTLNLPEPLVSTCAAQLGPGAHRCRWPMHASANAAGTPKPGLPCPAQVLCAVQPWHLLPCHAGPSASAPHSAPLDALCTPAVPITTLKPCRAAPARAPLPR
jgi:hypothetical protein